MIKYPFKIVKSKSHKGKYIAEAIDLKGCITQGNSLEDILNKSKSALNLYLSVADLRKKSLPRPSTLKEKNIKYIEADLNIGFISLLRIMREEKKLSQKDIAKKLEISQQAYQQFENPKTSNLSLETISKLTKILSFSLLIKEEKSNEI